MDAQSTSSYTPSYKLRQIGGDLYDTMRNPHNAPPKDRYRIITRHDSGAIMCSDTGLGCARTDKKVVLQVVQQGRTDANKERFYSALYKALQGAIGLPPGDLDYGEQTRRLVIWRRESSILDGRHVERYMMQDLATSLPQQQNGLAMRLSPS